MRRGRGRGRGYRGAKTFRLNPDAKPFKFERTKADGPVDGTRRSAQDVSRELQEIQRKKKELQDSINQKKRKLEEEIEFKNKQNALREAAKKSLEEAERKAKIARLQGGFTKAANELASSKSATEQIEQKSKKVKKTERKITQTTKEDILRVLHSLNDYEVLQVNLASDTSAIRKNYLHFSRAFHPDKCKIEGAKDAFLRITKAYKNLQKSHS